MRNSAAEALVWLGAVAFAVALVLLVIGGAGAGLLNLVVLTLVVFAFVASETRKSWGWRWYWHTLGLAFVLHCCVVLSVVRRIGTDFPTMYDFVFGLPEIFGLYIALNWLAHR